ncbi:MAG: glycosyltransferase family 2 protein [Holosporales bacterium]|jgi:glycosyltransferase involved in cell wall biosynthesis
MSITLSALVVAHNEEARLEACLQRLGFADEIVVVLDKCTDGSEAIARRFTDRLISGSWPLEGPRRNTGIEACRGEWVLEVDADEWVSPELAIEIKELLKAPKADYYLVPIDNYIGKRLVRDGWGGSFGTRSDLALFRRDAKRWGGQRVHPSLTLKGVRGPRLTASIRHQVDEDLSETFARLNRYSDLKARDWLDAGNIGTLGGHIRRFFFRFWKCYVRRGGYREGIYGIAIALCAGLFPLLSYLKAREIRETTLASDQTHPATPRPQTPAG